MRIEFTDFWSVHYLLHLLERRRPHRLEASRAAHLLNERSLVVPARAAEGMAQADLDDPGSHRWALAGVHAILNRMERTADAQWASRRGA